MTTFRKIFKAFFKFEAKRLPKKRAFILAASLLITAALFFVQVGVGKYKRMIEQKDMFQESERIKVGMYQNYTQYGTYGYRMLFIPSPFSVFFMNSTAIPDITAFVDSGERLKIYQPLKGDNIFKTRKFGFMDFSGIILFFGSLLTLFYCWDGFGSVEYMKTLSGIANHNHVFLAQAMSRALMVCGFFTVLTASAFLLVRVNGLALEMGEHLFCFVLLVLLQALFFAGLGTAAGNFKSRVNGIFFMLTCWFFLVFVTPAALNYWVEWKADNITSLFKLEMEKFKLVMDFEKRAIEMAGKFDYGKSISDLDKTLVLSYRNNEYKEIHKLEQQMRLQIETVLMVRKGEEYFVTGEIRRS
ncbi:MAG: hypothetical protein GY940_32980 [bacterium]|nr:hypothetical protein [bacterium]